MSEADLKAPIPSDSELRSILIRLGRDDESALSKLIDIVGSLLYANGLRLTGDRFAAEEILNDTIYKVWKHRKRYDSRKGSVSWVVQIYRNTAIDHCRRVKQSNPRQGLDPSLYLQSQDNVEESVISDLSLIGLLAGLNDFQTRLFLMKYRDDLSEADIARNLGIPKGTVKSRLSYAMSKLRRLLSDENL